MLQHGQDAVLTALGMAWQVGWSLVLGFLLSALLQVFVDRDAMVRALGRNGASEIALATLAGAASSSCSYAAASVSRTLLAKGAGLAPTLAFLFASTNLVAELGLVLLLLLGWQFLAAEWLGGLVLIAIMALLVRLAVPAWLVEAARRHATEASGHDHAQAVSAGPVLARLGQSETWIRVSQHFAADLAMLWKDLLLGFVIAGALAALVPAGVWQALFVHGAPPWIQLPANALLGPLIAALSFVCSIGNVPMAAVLWGAGVSFGGVLAFLYADLLVLPLLDVYRRYFGWRMAAAIAGLFYVTMVLAALLMDLLFRALGWVPVARPAVMTAMHRFAFDYTFVLNLIFGAVAIALLSLARRHPAVQSCPHHAAPPRQHACH